MATPDSHDCVTTRFHARRRQKMEQTDLAKIREKEFYL